MDVLHAHVLGREVLVAAKAVPTTKPLPRALPASAERAFYARTFALVTLALAEYVGAAHALPADLATLPTAAVILALFIIQFGYFLLFELFMHGQTPGKRLFNLQVVKENGYPLSAVDSTIRNLVRIIDFFPVGYGVGLIVMFLNARARRLGDVLAYTVSVSGAITF